MIKVEKAKKQWYIKDVIFMASESGSIIKTGLKPDLIENSDYYKHCDPFLFMLIFEDDIPKICSWEYPKENSWRCAIALDLCGGSQDDLLFRLDKKWYETQNIRHTYTFCLNDNKNDSSKFWTNFMTITGEGTITDLLKNQRDISSPNLDDLIVLIEIPDSHHRWSKKGDLDIHCVEDFVITDRYKNNICVVFKDHEIWFLKKNIPISQIKKFMTYEGALKHDRECEIKKYLEKRDFFPVYK